MMFCIFILSTRRGRVVNTMTQLLYPLRKHSNTHFTGSMEGYRQEKISCPHQGSKLDHPAHSKSP
jgi:hypothetical protein